MGEKTSFLKKVKENPQQTVRLLASRFMNLNLLIYKISLDLENMTPKRP